MLSNTTSDSDDVADIFDEKKVAILTYEKYHALNRFCFVRRDAERGAYHYMDKYNGKAVIVKRPMKTFDDYNDYLVYVF
jgi:hypothetical protein|uniref:Lef-10 n=1 Tax=Lymantria dispar multicapsid nuclear polyhedrosis virus TaxID=10449 RepID=A0A0A0YUT6_NPVLD|nr:hypothetical protein [Lymantria dispar multiple nucleopolyhedrovirus]AJR20330.1 oorf-43 peptide [Lymantria dispar multiple nucleopolyhedrovirus]AMO27554.1 hypothetical protein [Lymantria dispar multiple nucleopolyhedrovirus]AMO27909.1 hypothetical protein [Lymantria dispar multiple nucleopolyhedrovirus]AMO65549.1 Orf-53 protein [Lymantria dispar multiple nucleopolyhedrovirus]